MNKLFKLAATFLSTAAMACALFIGNSTASPAIEASAADSESQFQIVHESKTVTLDYLEEHDYYVEMNVYMVNNPGFRSHMLISTYDINQVTVDSVSGDYVGSTQIMNHVGFLINGFISAANNYGDVTLYTIKYKVNENAAAGDVYSMGFIPEPITSAAGTTYHEVYTEDSENIVDTVDFVDGTLTIADDTTTTTTTAGGYTGGTINLVQGKVSVSLEDLRANGYKVSVPVSIENNPGFWSYCILTSYDTAINPTGNITGDYFAAFNDSEVGFTVMTYANHENIYGDVDLYYIEYQLPTDVTPGTVYDLGFYHHERVPMELFNEDSFNYHDYLGYVDGYIEITGDSSTTTTTSA
ncbi:MAG: hypothetical protein IJO29_05080, partial [Oscillospiraceae bacterium]|nr:hypothetical protein [Oscillospiraceae bacterium]